MELTPMIAQINAEIERLTQIRDLMLQGSGSATALAPSAPKKEPLRSRSVVSASVPVSPAKKQVRSLTPEGRKKIAEAMKRRWAETRNHGVPAPNVKKSAKKIAKKSVAKKAVVKKRAAKKAVKSSGETTAS